MATEIKSRRGTAAQHDDSTGFTGAEGELTVDTTNDTVRVHDGSTKGGHRLAKYTEVQASNELSEMLDVNLTSPADGSVLKYDNASSKWIDSSKLTETATGINVTGTVIADGVNLGDNEKIQLGASQDLEIFHDGTNSYLQDAGDGQLILNTTNGGGVYVQSAGETMAQFISNGAVNLYHDNAQKLATTSTGIDVTGAITVSGNVDGRDIAADGLVLDAIEAGADVTDTVNVVAALTAGDNITIAADGTITATDTNTTYSVQDGELSQNSFTNDDHTKLNGIEASADVTDTTNVVAALTAGNNIAIAGNGTISATDTTYSVQDGELSQNNFTNDDHTKLNGIEASADVTDTTNVVAALTAGTNITIAGNGTIASANTEYTGGTGLTLSGTTFNVDAAQTQITSVGTLTSLTTGDTTINGNLEVKSTTADGNFLPEIRLKRDGGVDAGDDGDVLGALVFEGDNFDGTQKEYARIGVSIKDDGTGVGNGSVRGEIRFATAFGGGGGGVTTLEEPSFRIDNLGVHLNEISVDSAPNFYNIPRALFSGLKYWENNGTGFATEVKCQTPTQDNDIMFPDTSGNVVIATIAGGGINGGDGVNSARTTWSKAQMIASPNSTYVHYNTADTNDLVISPPHVGLDINSDFHGNTWKFTNNSTTSSKIILDLDGYGGSALQYYTIMKYDGSASGSSATILSTGSNLTVSGGGQITLTAVDNSVMLVEGIGYS